MSVMSLGCCDRRRLKFWGGRRRVHAIDGPTTTPCQWMTRILCAVRNILTINPQAIPDKRGGAAAMADTAAAPAELTPLQQAVGLTRNFVAGTFAGIMECLVGHPLVSAAPGALELSFRWCSCSPKGLLSLRAGYPEGSHADRKSRQRQSEEPGSGFRVNTAGRNHC